MKTDLYMRLGRLLAKLPRIEAALELREQVDIGHALSACQELLAYYQRHGGKPCESMLQEIAAVVEAAERERRHGMGTGDPVQRVSRRVAHKRETAA
jgi:DNA-binding GntR family transcriptional regulator